MIGKRKKVFEKKTDFLVNGFFNYSLLIKKVFNWLLGDGEGKSCL